MPYYITETNPDCSGWGVEKENGELIGCHTTKQDAIDQMVAVSIAEDMEPGGERAAPDALSEGDFVSWNSSGGRARGRIEYVMREGTLGIPGSLFSIDASEDDPAALIRIYEADDDGWEPTEILVGHKFSTLTKIAALELPSDNRAENIPQYIRQAAARGLELRREGFGGDGLTDQTIREARDMARGAMTDDKVVRANAWAARHAVDLEAPQNRNPDDDGFPGAGAVAHYLWGIDPTNPGPARRWLERETARIQERAVMSDVEIRMLDTEPLELRDNGSGIGTFSGWAMRYGQPSLPLPFTEYFQPGSFTRSLKSRNDIRLYVNHDDRMVLASRRAKTLRLEDRSEGLWVEADLPDTSYARDLRELMKRGDVHTQSIGFTAVKDEWNSDGSERRVTEARLHETSIVTGVAAYSSTSASVRNIKLIAKRTSTDAEALTDAISALEAGDSLTTDQHDLLRTVVDRAAGIPEKLPTTPVSLMQKKLDLLYKAF